MLDQNNMADIYFYQEDPDDDSENTFSDGYGGSNPDAGLTPVAKMEKYASSDNIFNRQMVARTVLETLRQVTDVVEDTQSVFMILARLGQDVEPVVRAELMEQVPHIAMYCQEVPEHLSHVVPTHLLPLVVTFLTDKNNQVRKTSQAALLVLLEQGLVEKSDVEEQVCPVIIKFTEADSLDDYRTEAVALLSKMAPMIGREMSERLFLERFAALCVDPLFHVRKVCAANFGDFSGVVGPESTEKILLPKFFYLCEDGVWGVRKACADVFMPVSCVCSPTVRQTELSPLFINLLRDQSRWVRMAAFQALGPFISTFADPAITALLHNENGEIIITDAEQLAERLNILEKTRSQQRESSSKTCSASLNSEEENTVNNNTDDRIVSNTVNNNVEEMDEREDEWSAQLVATSSPKSLEERRANKYFESRRGDNSNYSTFLYWREPVASLDLVDIDLDASEGDIQDTEMVDVENKLKSETSETSETLNSLSESSNSNKEEPKKSEDVNNIAEEVKQEDEAVKELEEDVKLIEVTDDEDSLEENKEEESKEDTEKGEKEEKEVKDEKDEKDEKKEKSGEDKEGEEDSEKSSGSQETSTLEMFQSSSAEKENISTFDPQNRWGSFTSLHSSRSSLDSRSTEVHPPDPALPKGPPETDQSIVPQLLIDHYVSMIDPSRAQTVDNDIARHCAFSLPAVALTLGRSNWPLLKETYETLANDMQWKVRRTLASSIHELGVILGEEVAAQDLVPIFNGFIKDLDEVRIGMLKHLADFLKLLQEKERQEYLPKLEAFLKMDNERNWRFRLELAEQLGLLVNLFTPEQVKAYLAPIGLTLVQDKVAAVRIAATVVLSNIIQLQDTELNNYLNGELADKLAHSTHWNRRQTFGVLCSELVISIPYSSFSQDLLPHLLDLSWDRVPNVRMQVAKVLGYSLPDEYYDDESLTSRDLIVQALNQLSRDDDSDVREAAASGHRVNNCPPPVQMEVVVGGEDEEGVSGSPSWAEIAAK